MKKVRNFVASVSYRKTGQDHTEEWPVWAWDHPMATQMAVAYAVQVLKLKDFELRIVGS
ncbi:MAG TPA: hypothetical protein VKK31_17480 [Thermoanaerobaculia bacterium]|nr:hypothetical protein [Thermoanaerobaculia bacterium]